MKVIHLSTSLQGGAGLTALLLAEMQREFGHDSQVVTRKSGLPILSGIKSKLSTAVSVANADGNYSQLTHHSISTLDLNEIRRNGPDQIFVHNWFNFLSLDDLVQITNEFPTIFIAHDARLATGGCHVTLGCKGHNTGCRNCPAAKCSILSSNAKKSTDRAVESFGRYGLVTPSNWLMRDIRGSSIEKFATVKKSIGNPSGVGINVSTNTSSQSNKKFHLLFVASDLDAKYKGFDLLVSSLKILDESNLLQRKLTLKIVGQGKYLNLPEFSKDIELKFLGGQESSRVHQLMTESDALIVPSLSENYPGVIGEAQMLGCVVLASNVGGIPEMVEHGVTGMLFDPTPTSCAKLLIEILSSPEDKKLVRIAKEKAHIRHDAERINSEYDEVIKRLRQEW
jgi:glycosyltransferase involved in cell wall biosynthesis